MQTIQEAKIYLRENFDKGVNCPCCGQFVKLYKRKLNSVMARCLIKMTSLQNGYNHVREIVKGISDTGTNDFSKLKYWGLIEEMNNDDLDKKTSGYWRLTKQGLLFAKNQINVPKYAEIYNTKLIGFSAEQTNIIDSLGTKFNYNELMQNK
jgi:tRNA(His) 5'-end guanylyltransferase